MSLKFNLIAADVSPAYFLLLEEIVFSFSETCFVCIPQYCIINVKQVGNELYLFTTKLFLTIFEK